MNQNKRNTGELSLLGFPAAEVTFGMFGQDYKFEVGLLSYLRDAKLRHCSHMNLRRKCIELSLVAASNELTK